MKKYRRILMGVSMSMLIATPALAVDTTRTYNSGILTGLFLAFCALVVVVQLMPTILLLIEFVKGLVKGTEHKAHRHGSRG